MGNSSVLVVLLAAAMATVVVPGAALTLSNMWDAFDCSNLTTFARISLTDHYMGYGDDILFPPPVITSAAELTLALDYLVDKFRRLREELRDESNSQLLSQKLRLLRAFPELTSQLLEVPGVLGRVIGDVLYVAQCTPVQVQLRWQVEDCYDAVPVYDNDGRPCFADPSSRILVPHAEKIPCRRSLAPLFKMGPYWTSFNPYVLLEGRRMNKFNLAEAARPQLAGMTGETISADEQSDFVAFMMAPLLRAKRADDAATTPVSRTTDFPTTTERARVARVCDKDRGQQAQAESRRLTPTLLDLGPLGHTEDSLLAVLVVLWLARYALTVLLNLHAIWRLKGCSWALCTAFFPPVANYVLHRHHGHHAKQRGLVYLSGAREPLQRRAENAYVP